MNVFDTHEKIIADYRSELNRLAVNGCESATMAGGRCRS